MSVRLTDVEGEFRDGIIFLYTMENWFNHSLELDAIPSVPDMGEFQSKVVWWYMAHAVEMAKETVKINVEIRSAKLAKLHQVADHLPLENYRLWNVRDTIMEEMNVIESEMELAQMERVNETATINGFTSECDEWRKVGAGTTITEHREFLERRMQTDYYPNVDCEFVIFLTMKEQLERGMRENLL